MRIRSIKPEFWRSDDVAALSIEDRLLFIGLWSYVDDSGIGVDKLPHICADLFAHDLAENPTEVFARVTGGLRELSSRGMIQRYTVDGKPYLYVTNWTSHQRIDKPSKRRFPLPDQADRAGSSDPREDSGRVPVTLAPGAVEQRNRGTGEQGTLAAPAAAPSAQTILAEWIDRCTVKPAGRVIGHLGKEVKALLDEGFDHQLVSDAVAEWQSKGLHPSTLPSVLNGMTNSGGRIATTTKKVSAGLDLVAKYEAEERAQIEGNAS